MSRRIVSGALAGLLCAGSIAAAGPSQAPGGPAPAPAPSGGTKVALSPEELMARIDRMQRDLHSLSAEFVQLSRVKLFRQELRSEGRMLYQKAGAGSPAARLRWEYLRPDPSTVLLIGDRATLRMGTLPPQTFDTGGDPKMRAIFAQLRLWLGQGELTTAQGDYDVSVGGKPAQPALLLSPRSSTPLSATFVRIELHVDGQTLQLQRLLLVEKSGDEKEIIFSKIQRNPALSDAQFAL